MSIEINGTQGRSPAELGDTSALRPRPDQKAGNGVYGSAVSGSTSDRVSLTDQASQLQALEAQIASLPVVDTQRVHAVQHSIATGSMQIDPASVADKLLKFEAGLGAPASGQ